ncbi:uncharacterized protein BYT42DRAFT_572307 [Radiomyces spectabilis]|uniref:uncharacterized protein n=1 Tax=Radiomyces spectabilis TaxID=64574 RepID=UPI00221E8EDE|nr:uncharacterized protein BYT42DRAFT_572307 [Radiomyces spectabilis]KAI8377953.1 hypothetical protein BYT42DRAFT_572307 [Radiomyces spectabilis]
MHIGLLSNERLSFDPFKPIILRGSPTEDASSVFAGNVVLSLSKPSKITSITVRLKSTATTFWPEGIGARGTRLTAETPLNEQTLEILPKTVKQSPTVLPAGVHRFAFAFAVPNSLVETIEDVYGRVRHVVEAQVIRSGLPLFKNWHYSKPVLVLRTYMSNSLLTNNSLQDLSRTFEKHMVCADMEVVIEAAAFSSGDLFYIRVTVQPHRKHSRLEHMELRVVESRRYSVPEMRAWRTDSATFPLPFAFSTPLADDGASPSYSTEALRPAFEPHGKGVDLVDSFAHRVAFFTPTCQQNIHHSTHFKEILFRHHLEIDITLSYLDSVGQPVVSRTTSSHSMSTSSSQSSHEIPLSTSSSSTTTTTNTTPSASASVSASASASTAHHASLSQQDGPSSSGWQNMLLRLRKSKNEKDKVDGRRREIIMLDTPITVFDCRLKEDYGRLPSYFELSDKRVSVPLTMDGAKRKKGGFSPSDGKRVISTDKDDRPHAFYCDCYREFSKQMELASQPLFFPEPTPFLPTLDRMPSRPPPDYGA